MAVTKHALDQAFVDYGSKYGGLKEDYFGALYLASEFDLCVEDVAHEVAFGGNDYGIDAFHLSRELHNFYIYQFKWSENHALFKDSFKRLISAGMERIFGNPLQDNEQNQLLLQLKAAIHENQAVIDRVFVHFVFNGDPTGAEQSAVLDSLREDLESKKYLIDQFFGDHKVSLTFEFVSNQSKKLGGLTHTKNTYKYKIGLASALKATLNSGQKLYIGFLSLFDLYRMYQDMGQRFFERNIRAGLSAERPPNRAIRQALSRILVQKHEDPGVFLFNHNGATIAAERLDFEDGNAIITEPRLLNGAQTVTSLARFIEENQGNAALQANPDALKSVEVMVKIITNCDQPFIVNVTICNNRQNPVDPWNLRASDALQLSFQDAFREQLGIFYERQEASFENLSDDDLEEMGISQFKAIEIKRLAKTFLAAQGEIDRMSRLPDVFESEKTYLDTFREKYATTDARRILLAYKIQFRLNRIIREIVEKGPAKYIYLGHARNLVWALLVQGILNDSGLPKLCENFGVALRDEADFKEYLLKLASTRVRPIIANALNESRYVQQIDDEKYSFLRTKAIYQRCMNIAYDKYDWKKHGL